jgi:PAS domain S-box-containing protein
VAVVIGCLISIGFPVTFYILEATSLKQTATIYAEQFSNNLEGLVLKSSTLWKYQDQKYKQILQNSFPQQDVATIRVLDEAGLLIDGYGYTSEKPKVWWNRYAPVGSAPIIFNNRQVGVVQIEMAQDKFLGMFLVILLVSTITGTGLAILVYHFPVKVVQGMEGQIHKLIKTVQRSSNESNRLAHVAQASEAALQEAHDELEIKVTQRTAELSKTNEQLKKEIVERRQTEKSLSKSLATNRALINAIPDLMFCIRKDGTFVDFKAASEEHLLVPPSEFLSKNLYEVLPPEIAQPTMNCVEQALQTGNVQIFEYQLLLNNSLHDYETRIAVSAEDEVISIVRDITERKQAEENMRKSQEMLQLVMDNIPQSIFWKDRNSVYLGCNHNFARLAGIGSPENIFGKTDYDLPWQKENADFSRECDRQVMETDTPEYHLIEPLLLPDGKQFWLETNKIPLHDFEGNVVSILGTFEDITERKQAEEDIHNALEKEKELGELKSHFVTMTSHEFRTPLATILSSADLLQKYSYKLSEEQKFTHLQQIQITVKHMNQMLNDVLLIGKAEARKLEYNPAPLDLEQFCHALVAEIQLTTNSPTIAFCSQGQCTNASIDEKLLRHILSNLLSNAIKYSPQGGTIHFELIYHQETVTFQVRDEGIGIPAVDQAQLFDTFHRASNVGTISGTGLGLAIVKKSVDLHGGSIIVASESGVGTTFKVRIPLTNRIATDD